MPRFCPTCRDEVPAGVYWCPRDGTPLEEPAADTQPTDPLLGTTVSGRYEVRRQLGVGGFGVVYLAHQTTIDRPVAVKVLARHAAADAEVRKRFLNEARAISRLNSPFTVRLIDFGSLDDGRLFMVTEFIDGETLDAIAKHGKIAVADSVRIADQICQSLHEAHGLGIIHRDLKPQNVMRQRIADEWIVKVLDFGIAKLGETGTLTAANSVLGTPQYMSPEQARGEIVDPRSDLYSLGVLLYELVAGKPPFQGGTVSSLLYRHIHEAPAWLSEAALPASVPPALEAVVMRLLSKRVEDRFQSAREVQDALANANIAEKTRSLGLPRFVSADTAAMPTPEDPLAPPLDAALAAPTAAPTSRRRRSGWLVAVGAVLAVLVVGIGALALTREAPPRPQEPVFETVAQPVAAAERIPPASTPPSVAAHPPPAISTPLIVAPGPQSHPGPDTPPMPASATRPPAVASKVAQPALRPASVSSAPAKRPEPRPSAAAPSGQQPESWQVKPGFE